MDHDVMGFFVLVTIFEGDHADILLPHEQRNLPAPGLRPGTWLLGMGAVCIYGFYKLGQGISEQK